jgi:hypothetical protein
VITRRRSLSLSKCCSMWGIWQSLWVISWSHSTSDVRDISLIDALSYQQSLFHINWFSRTCSNAIRTVLLGMSLCASITIEMSSKTQRIEKSPFEYGGFISIHILVSVKVLCSICLDNINSFVFAYTSIRFEVTQHWSIYLRKDSSQRIDGSKFHVVLLIDASTWSGVQNRLSPDTCTKWHKVLLPIL